MTTIAHERATTANAALVARLERLPVTRRLLLIRIIIGSATFFDAYTVLVIAFAMPQLVDQWHLTPGQVGMILSGKATFWIGDEERTLGPGDLYRVPGGVKHKVVALEEPVRVLDLFTPVREEYQGPCVIEGEGSRGLRGPR